MAKWQKYSPYTTSQRVSWLVANVPDTNDVQVTQTEVTQGLCAEQETHCIRRQMEKA
jgi:hypothetical protein